MRDIKNGYFTWLEREAVSKIKSLPYKQRGSSLLVYFGLCDIASVQKDSKEICCFKFDIAEKACVSEKTVQRCLPLLESLKIIKISPQDRKSNGRFEKVSIWLVQNNLTAGQLRDSCETDARQMRDLKSDTIKKENKEKENKENNIVAIWNSILPIKGKNETIKQGVPVMKECRKETDDIREEIRKLKYSKQEIVASMLCYRNEICARGEGSYAEHRFSLWEFLKQSNGCRKYMQDVSDEMVKKVDDFYFKNKNEQD